MKIYEITEKYKHADHARGKGPMPKKTKPSKSGEQKHALHGKLVGEEQLDEIGPALGVAAKWLIKWAVQKGAWAVIKFVLKRYWKKLLVGTLAYQAMQEGWDWVTEQIGEEMTQLLIDNKFEIGMAVALIIGGVTLKRFFEKKGDELVQRYAESINEMTSAGGIASVAMPMGGMVKRNPTKKTRSKKKR